MKVVRLVPLVAAVALTGCAGGNPTSAATVNGQVISAAAVDQLVRDCPALGPDKVTQQLAASNLIAGQLVNQAGAVAGLTFTADDARQAFRDHPQAGQVLGEHPGCAEFLVPSLGVGKLKELGRDDVMQRISNADVAVNPRYGEWNPDTLTIQGSGSLSEPLVPAVEGG